MLLRTSCFTFNISRFVSTVAQSKRKPPCECQNRTCGSLCAENQTVSVRCVTLNMCSGGASEYECVNESLCACVGVCERIIGGRGAGGCGDEGV